MDYSILSVLGLSNNQIKIYATLCKHVKLSTDILCELTSIPRTNIYGELQYLTEKGYLQRYEGRPIEYSAHAPSHILNEKRKEIFDNLEQTISDLQTNWKLLDLTQSTSVITGIGKEYLIDETLNMINSASTSIIFLIRFYFEEEWEDIIINLKGIVTKGIDVKIAVYPELALIDDIKVSLADFTVVKKGPIPIRALIIDQKTALLAFQETNDNMERVQTIKIPFQSFASLMSSSLTVSFDSFENLF